MQKPKPKRRSELWIRWKSSGRFRSDASASCLRQLQGITPFYSCSVFLFLRFPLFSWSWVSFALLYLFLLLFCPNFLFWFFCSALLSFSLVLLCSSIFSLFCPGLFIRYPYFIHFSCPSLVYIWLVPLTCPFILSFWLATFFSLSLSISILF